MPFREPVAESPDVKVYWEAAKAGGATGCQYVALLGLKPPANPIKLHQLVKHGLKYQSLERFQQNSQFSTAELAEVVAIKMRTLHRRKEEGRLDPEESDRLLRVSRVFAKTLDLFEGDAGGARRWFHTPAKALGGERPIALAGTDLGAREVEALIDRLERGVLT